MRSQSIASVLRWIKLRPSDGLHPLFRAQLDVLRAQMQSEHDGAVEPKTKPGRQGAAQQLLGALQRALSTSGEDEIEEQ